MTKTVLITGATGVLGAAIVTHLASLGWSLVLASREQEKCDKLADSLSHFSTNISCIRINLKDKESTETVAQRLAEDGIRVSHIVSNARSLDTLSVNDEGLTEVNNFMDEFLIDVVAPYRMIMGFSQSSEHDLKGLVTVGSQYGIVAPNPSLYNGDLKNSPIQYGVAKAALHHLTRELAIRLSPKVRVNCVAYGGFVGRSDADFQKRYGKLSPAGRMLEPYEAGGPVAFLLDDKVSSAITGHVLVADGGWSTW